jgi:PAS domain S-box-containing protein
MPSKENLLDVFRGWIRPFLKPLIAWIGLFAVSLLFVHVPFVLWVCSLCFLVLMVWAAWCGYGPGLLIAVLTIYGAPRLLTPGKPYTDPIRFALFAGLLLLISRIATGKRRSEALLQTRVDEATKELRQQRDLFKRQSEMINQSHDGFITMGLDRAIQQWNRGTSEIYGWKEDEATGRIIHDLLHTQGDISPAAIDLILLKTGSWDGEVRQQRKDGTVIAVNSRQLLVQDDDGTPIGILEINHDITETKRLIEQLRQSQKLDSLGQLAGGVAHDFNNLLTVIIGYGDMILEDIAEGEGFHDELNEILKAARSASSITQQLLTFSRREVSSPQLVSLNALIRNNGPMLRRLIGEDVEVLLKLADPEITIWADPTSIEQVLLNLVINARDAMPSGGKVIIESSETAIDEDYLSTHLRINSGRYAMLTVTDTGTGIPADIQARIFEPFFTTKEPGKGTGLGLSTVYGAVKQSQGTISVYSELGKGTSFKILLPIAEAPSLRATSTAIPSISGLRGTETLLVVEDDQAIRKYIHQVLVDYGYTVLLAANGREALEMASTYLGPIHLLLTDVVMPVMGGSELSQQFANLRAGIPVLHMSGYTDRLWRHDARIETSIQKPFTAVSLLTAVRALLGSATSMTQYES